MAKIGGLFLPPFLYRYRTLIDIERDALCSRSIFFSSVDSLNDPMEASFRGLRDLWKNNLIDGIPFGFERLGICCFSSDKRNDLMWSHYSGRGGICVEYRTADLLRVLPDDVALCRVDYLREVPDADMLVNLTAREMWNFVLSKKNIIWQYENEWRFISEVCGLKDINNSVSSIYLNYDVTAGATASMKLIAKDLGAKLFKRKLDGYDHSFREIEGK